MYVGNLGDSEVVVARGSGRGCFAECVSFKHKPTDPQERERIEKAGGHVIFGRVLGSLAVSRALGDAGYKSQNSNPAEDFVSSDPYVRAVAIGPDVPFIIVACDGLWDRLTYQDAVDYVRLQFNAHVPPDEAAARLADRAIDVGSQDNVSVVVVYLTWP